MASESASDHASSRIANMTPGDGAASELDSPGRQQRRAASLEAELRNKLKRSKWNAAEDSNEKKQDNEEDKQQGPTKIRRRMLKVKVREREAEEQGSDAMRQQQQQQHSPRSLHSQAPSSEPHPSSPNRETASYAVQAHQERPNSSTPPILPKRWPRSHLAPPRSSHPPLTPCRSVYNYTRLNHIEEGTYGIVFRAKCNSTGNIYALKKLKLEEERQGFPITSLREVMALMVAGGHENVVGVREIVVGDTLNQIFIVMPFVEHDLKTLLEEMPHPFVQSEVKTLLRQLLSAVAHCHANWILHRDLKTSNLLMNNRGQIKVADFGLARKFGDPLGEMTQLVVTLWYRSPELLLGAKEYSTAVDVWSVGCIFAELMQKLPLFQGRGEIDQIGKIFSMLGKPSEEAWPSYRKLPLARSINPIGPPYSSLRKQFTFLTDAGHDLLAKLLAYDPDRRISAEAATRHPYFEESPMPKHPSLFSSFPSIAAGERRQRIRSPPAPPRPVARSDQEGGQLMMDLV